MAKPELGTKRVCPTTGRKFYDLNKDPIVSPYTGQAFPRSMFEPQAKAASVAKPEKDEEEEAETEDSAVEVVSLDEADAEASEKEAVVTSEDDIEGGEDEEVASDDDDDDTFLEEDEEDDGDVSDLIDSDIDNDEDS